MGTSIEMNMVFEEIQRTVADAVAEKSVLRTSTAARQIKGAYPNCALSEKQIEDLLIGFAAKAGIAVQFGHELHDVPYSAPTGVRL